MTGTWAALAMVSTTDTTKAVQTTSAFFKLEWPQILWLNQLCGPDFKLVCRCRHLRPRNSARPTDGRGAPSLRNVAFDMSIVDPNAPVTQVPWTGPGACP